MSICWSISLSVRLSISRQINIFGQISDRGGILGSLYASLHLAKMVYRSVGLSIHRSSEELSHLVTSSYNCSINMRTHRWPYGPCSLPCARKRCDGRTCDESKNSVGGDKAVLAASNPKGKSITDIKYGRTNEKRSIRTLSSLR